MPPITVSAEIDRPALDVFVYATDPTRFHEWQNGVVDGNLDSPGEPEPGAICRTTRRIGGANRTSASEISHFSPPTTWGIRGIDGPIRATVDLTVESLSTHRSRLTIAVDFEGHGIGRILVPMVVRREARREMPGNLAKLKHLIESG
ncbi:SRPBCC family protein [Actinoplanes auranticolor]|uniref:Polyketide cyclase/dehydrase/lipid transport protein n=1 Tax=Actinoplanes auranticolor TaxID=47988 RepID=A0A919SGQ5_9ACTN|nr:SRPBCC family protein [Actinoplanes auranticolor]GIM71369.1 hypothetical protein Aau02nite_45670 [Actinoplanes auranticolor]